jgi:hypothetical protein
MKSVRSYGINGVLASCVLFFVAWNRDAWSPASWILIGLLALAVLWNLFQLGRRLHSRGGGKDLWHLQRTLLFWVIGILNTALIRPAEVGSWKNLLGWAVLLLASVDTLVLIRKELASNPGEQQKPD